MAAAAPDDDARQAEPEQNGDDGEGDLGRVVSVGWHRDIGHWRCSVRTRDDSDSPMGDANDGASAGGKCGHDDRGPRNKRRTQERIKMMISG